MLREFAIQIDGVPLKGKWGYDINNQNHAVLKVSFTFKIVWQRFSSTSCGRLLKKEPDRLTRLFWWPRMQTDYFY